PGEVWVAGYSNDVFAYLASKRVIQEGGYEGGGAMKYFTSFPHPSAWDESVEDVVIDAVHRLRKE
ncbi:MAG: neutral ceramidase, partial [Yoonia sp.]